MTLVNRSDHAIGGLRVFSSGPGDAFAVANVSPLGWYESDLLGAFFASPVSVVPSQAGQVEILVSPISAGSFHFTFTPMPRPGQQLPRTVGESIVVAADIEVAP